MEYGVFSNEGYTHAFDTPIEEECDSDCTCAEDDELDCIIHGND